MSTLLHSDASSAHTVARGLDFKVLTPNDRAWYERCLFFASERGCEYSFANLFCWGDQRIALVDGTAVVLSAFGKHRFYLYPVGKAPERVLPLIKEDAAGRGIPAVIGGLRPSDVETLDGLYPAAFRFESRRGSFDYVYAIDDLADLAGKKYHRKRNHDSRFYAAHPTAHALPMTEDMIPAVRALAERWYAERAVLDPDGDYDGERAALARALEHYTALGLIGLVLWEGEGPLAFTLGSRFSADTLDVHFEKALTQAEGAYAAVNRAYARYIRDICPDIRFLNREEDMDIEGLRRAKQNYFPHHMVEKHRAYPLEVRHDG